MTKSISSASAKATPKTAAEADTNGTPPTEETSEDISGASTTWVVVTTDGKQARVTVSGSDNGRISYGRSSHRDGAEVRFYRNSTTKVYDAVIPNVMAISNTRVTIEEIVDPEKVKAEETFLKARAKVEERRAKEALERVSELIVKREYADGTEPIDF